MDFEVKRNFLLMGKTGEGKSATGNTLLDRKYFKASASSTSVTKKVDHTFGRFDNYLIHVVDGPGLVDTELNQISEGEKPDANSAKAKESEQRAKEIEAVAKDMDIALAMCYGGVDAFLLVVRLGGRFTKENIETVESLETIFGPEYMNNVVVVMTNGDSYERSMEEDGRENLKFHDWCRSQKGALKELYDKCKGRFVLFNNIEKDKSKKRQHVLELLKIVDHMRTDKGSYDADCFKQADAERVKLIVTLKAPQLKLEIQVKVSLLNGQIEKIDQGKELSQSEKDDIETQILDLKEEIVKQDKSIGILRDMLELADKLHQNLNNVAELKKIAKEKEEIRRKMKIWSMLGTVTTIAGGAVCLASPVVGAAVAAGTSMASLIPRAVLGSKEKNLTRKESELKEQMHQKR